MKKRLGILTFMEKEKQDAKGESKEEAAQDSPELMLFSSIGKAVRNIRERQKLEQKQCVARAVGAEEPDQVKPGLLKKWSRIETGNHQLFGPEEAELLFTGLQCTELELWKEKIRIEREHYREHASEVGEPKPGYDTSTMALYVDELYRYKANELPPNAQEEFHELRNTVVAMATQLSLLIDRVGGIFRSYRNVASSS